MGRRRFVRKIRTRKKPFKVKRRPKVAKRIGQVTEGFIGLKTKAIAGQSLTRSQIRTRARTKRARKAKRRFVDDVFGI